MRKKTQKIVKKNNNMIRQALEESQKPLILAHIRPDGDAVGSMIALGLALEEIGKKSEMVLSDGLPKRYRFLSGSEKIKTEIDLSYDLVIALDCSNYERLSSPDKIDHVHINIDHHVTNENFADMNFVLPEFASTTSILAKFIPEWGLAINKDIANALLMGMITDTIGFRTSNVSPAYFRIAADLQEKGADLVEMYHRGLTLHSAEASKIWGFALSRLETDGLLAWTSILYEDRKIAEYSGTDDADLTNHLSSIENIDISILFNEQKDDKVKVSWRSRAPIDVTRVAAQFGGGGHPQASGAEIRGQLDEVKKQVIKETEKLLKGN